MYKGYALSAYPCSNIREQQIVINKRRTVGNLYKDIFSKRQLIFYYSSFRRNIVVHEIKINSSTSSLSKAS